MLWNSGGSGVVANTCSAGDFFSAVDGSGNFTCSTPPAGGSGDPVLIKGVAVTDGSGVDLVEGTGITITSNTGVSPDTATFAATLGTAITSSEITDGEITYADVNNTGTLAGNPTNGASSVWIGTTGLLWEGATSDTIETLLVAADPTSSDKTITLPDATGTVAVSATAPVTLSAAGAIGVTQNAGTDITADLEEETHATEHSLGGSDAITVTNLASACTDVQVLGGTAGGTGVECQTDDDVPESGDFGALALTGDVSSSGLTTTIGADKVTESMLKAVNGPIDEYILTYESTTGDFEWQNSIAATVTGASSLNTLLAGRAGTGNDTIISTDGAGTIYGSGTTANDLTLRANDDDTTTGEINLNAPRIDIYPSYPASTAADFTLIRSAPTATLTGGTADYIMVEAAPTFSIADSTSSQYFRAGGTVDRTGTTGSTLYQITGFHNQPTLTSSTTGGPLFQDAFYDASIVNQVSGTATQNTYQPISFLSKPTYKASSGATLTIGQTTGVDINPSWGVAAGGTLTNTTFSAFKLHAPNEIGGTLSLPTYIALDVEDLDTAGVTSPISVRSVGTTTELRHAGPARFGATGAVTSGKKLDVRGDTYIGGYLDLGDDIADITTNTASLLDMQPTVDISSTGTLNGSIFAPTTTNSSASSGQVYAHRVTPTLSSNAIDTFSALSVGGTVTQTATAAGFAGAAYLMDHGATYTSSAAAVHPRENVYSIFDHPTISSSATSGTATMASFRSVFHNPTVSRTGAGTFTLTNDYGFVMGGTYTESAGTLAVTNRIGLKYNDVTNTSNATAMTTNIAVDVADLSTTAGATTVAALQSAIASGTGKYFIKDDGGAQSKFTGKITTYNNIATAGFGLPIIVADSGVSATKTANFTSTSFTPPATAGAYRGSWIITTTSGTNTGTVQCTIDYVDSQGTTHTADIIPMASAAGTFGTTGTAASKQFRCGPWPLNINNAGTAIAMKVVITGSVNYTVQTILEQTS